tara:strand:- start:493 stop:669 length:177 start_codon:yes stop_codon:yes gene_type:complete
MQLRSGKKYHTIENQPFKTIPPPEKYKVDINFDEASKAWRKNKIDQGLGVFKYKTENI